MEIKMKGELSENQQLTTINYRICYQGEEFLIKNVPAISCDGEIYFDHSTMLIIQNEILDKITPQQGVYIDFEIYQKMIEELEDYELYMVAEERMKNITEDDWISQEEVMKELNITQEDIDNCEDVEIE